MAFELKLPDIGEGLTEAEVVEWLAGVGQAVAANEPIVSVETAKAVVDISAPRAGVLLHQGAPEGTILEVGKLLAVIGDQGEVWQEAGTATPPATSSAAAEPAETTGAAATAATGARPARAVPLVRKLAKTLGVDLAAVVGTGAAGQVTRADVEAAAAGTTAAPAPEVAGGGDVALSATRRAIAANMTRSWTEIPHVTVWGPADGTALLALREVQGAPVDVYLIRAALPVLAEFPDFNAHFDGTTLTHVPDVHMGVAIETPAGLVVPVVRNAHRLSEPELTAEIARLVEAAQSRRLTPDEMAGNTFTVSNVGAVGGGYGTPIIPHGTTAILSAGRAKDDVVVRNKAIAIAPLIPVALSFDHRVIDGASASRFLNRFVEELESLGAE